jgi:hypothetical protein
MSDWPSADLNTHVKIVSVALLASSIFIAIGLAAQSESTEKAPNRNDRSGTPSAQLPRSVDAVSAPAASAPAWPDRRAILRDPGI